MQITIIGGFLGAGKTTLLNRLIGSEYSRDAVVLVNDFGKISIDSRLVAGGGERLMTLANGCICCSIGNDFVRALIRITSGPRLPRRLIVEASGIADPAKIAEFAATDSRFALEAIPLLLDASSFAAQRTDPRIEDLVERQLAAADMFVLNKIDLVPECASRELAGWLESHFPRRPVLRTSRADVPLAVLFDTAPPRPRRRAVLVAPEDSDNGLFENFFFEADRPFDVERLARAIGMLSSGVLRGKGLIRTSDDPTRTDVFQMVGPRWSLVPAEGGVPDGPVNQLVLIGLKGSIEPELLRRLLDAALVG